jgi:hypothetical protein
MHTNFTVMVPAQVPHSQHCHFSLAPQPPPMSYSMQGTSSGVHCFRPAYPSCTGNVNRQGRSPMRQATSLQGRVQVSIVNATLRRHRPKVVPGRFPKQKRAPTVAQDGHLLPGQCQPHLRGWGKGGGGTAQHVAFDSQLIASKAVMGAAVVTQ